MKVPLHVMIDEKLKKKAKRKALIQDLTLTQYIARLIKADK